jgi:NAD(P)H-dependent FMN reductase
MTTHESTSPLRIAVVAGSTRPGRRSRLVADWARAEIAGIVGARAEVETVDLADYELPLLDEPLPAARGGYSAAHTHRWSRRVASFDGFVFVTPEYNHSMPASLKNAIDFLFPEWNDKAAGFVGYSLTGGVRAVEHLRLTLAEVKVACVRSQVALDIRTDFAPGDGEGPGGPAPAAWHRAVLERMCGELVEWAEALRAVRRARSAA